MLKSFIYLLCSYSVATSELGCLAKPAKPYPVCGPTYMRQIPH